METNSYTDAKGLYFHNNDAEFIPFEEWLRFFEEYTYLKQYVALKQGLTEAYEEVRQIERGDSIPVTLEEFLHEC